MSVPGWVFVGTPAPVDFCPYKHHTVPSVFGIFSFPFLYIHVTGKSPQEFRGFCFQLVRFTIPFP